MKTVLGAYMSNNAAFKKEEFQAGVSGFSGVELPSGYVPISRANLRVDAPANRLSDMANFLNRLPLALKRERTVEAKLVDSQLFLQSPEGLHDYFLGSWDAIVNVNRSSDPESLTMELRDSFVKTLVIKEAPSCSEQRRRASSRKTSPFKEECRGESGSAFRKGES